MTTLRTLATLVFVLLSPFALAGESTPVGLWKSVDDETGKAKALIRIAEAGGELRGTIERLFNEKNENPNPVCAECSGPQKGQPIVGLTIISGMKKDGEKYAGGQILDPGNGKTYRSTMEITDSGKKLKVRGYIGVPMLGRTQIWIREE